MDSQKEGSMNKAERERQQVGLSPEGVREINRPKSLQGDAFKKRVKGAANVLAAGITAAAGVGLAGTAQEALKNTPPPIIQENTFPQPKPPEGVVFPENTQADGSTSSPQSAPVEPFLRKRVFIPRVLKEVSQEALDKAERPPLFLREFGAPERGVIMRNKVEQGGGNPAWVEMGDQELFNNMLYLRETYGRSDLRLEITFYNSVNLLLRDPNAPSWKTENLRGVLNYDSWAGGNGTFQNGSILFKFDETQKTLRFYITLPETNPGKIPTQTELELLHLFFLHNIRDRIFASNESGNSNLPYPIRPGSSVAQDLDAHPPVIYENKTVARSALWIKLNTVPTYGGKSVDSNR